MLRLRPPARARSPPRPARCARCAQCRPADRAPPQPKRPQTGFLIRRVAWFAVEVSKRDGSAAAAASDLHGRFECDQRLSEIAGIGGNALIATAEYRVHAV